MMTDIEYYLTDMSTSKVICTFGFFGGVPRTVFFYSSSEVQVPSGSVKWHSYLRRENPRANCNPEGPQEPILDPMENPEKHKHVSLLPLKLSGESF